MVLKENPVTKGLHDEWRVRIIDRFGELIETDECLSLIQYLDQTPNKFYSTKSFDEYLNFLDNLTSQELQSLLNENENSLNLAIKTLKEINELQIHDIYYPNDDLELIDFVDKNIHYNYLKTLESCFYQFIYFPAVVSRKNRGKSIEKLDLYNCVEELQLSDFRFVKDYFNNTVRNGIAHGNVEIFDNDFRYVDKKGNETSLTARRMIRTFDDLVDCVNGFALATKLFFLSIVDSETMRTATMPNSILLEELQYQANGPAWKILNVFEGSNIRSENQVNIYVKNDFFDFYKVQFNSFRTAILTDRFSKGYNRIFINLKSRNSKFESAGWTSFDGDKLRQLREKGESRIEAYKGVMHDDLLFFAPKYKVPRLFYKIGTTAMIFKILFSLERKKYLETYFPQLFTFRECKTHSRSSYIVVQRVSACLTESPLLDIEDLIRLKARTLIRKAKNFSKKHHNFFTRFLPIGYMQVFVYEHDLRKRKLREGGLTPNLICILHINRTKKIKSPLPFGTVEDRGRYKIIWNDNWKGRELTGAKPNRLT